MKSIYSVLSIICVVLIKFTVVQLFSLRHQQSGDVGTQLITIYIQFMIGYYCQVWSLTLFTLPLLSSRHMALPTKLGIVLSTLVLVSVLVCKFIELQFFGWKFILYFRKLRNVVESIAGS